MAVHVRYKSLYISLSSSAKQQWEMTLSSTERGRRRLVFRIEQCHCMFSVSTFLGPHCMANFSSASETNPLKIKLSII